MRIAVVELTYKLARRFPGFKRALLSIPHTLSLWRMSALAEGGRPYDKDRRTIILSVHAGSLTGAPILGWNLAKRLSDTHNVVVVMLERGPLTDLFHPFCVASTYPRVGAIRNAEPALFKRLVLAQIFAKYRVDCILANSVEAEVMVTAGAMLDVPTIAMIHEFAEYTSAGRLKKVLTASSLVVFSSNLLLASAQRLAGCEIENAIVEPQGQCEVPNMLDSRSAPFEELFGEQQLDNAFLCIGCGQVQMRKGVDIFIAVAARVLRSRLNARFVWVGDGYEPDTDFMLGIWIRDQIERSGFGSRIRIIPAVSATNLTRLYESADVMLLSSRLDPLPNVAIDALHAGTPVVCFDNASGLPEYLREEEELESVIVPYLDAGAAADRIQEIAEDTQLRIRLSTRSADFAIRRFNMTIYASKISLMIAEQCTKAGRHT